MNLHRLTVFTAVYDCRGFTRAGTELHMTQPAVSIQIRALEDELGVPLFSRAGRSLEPTEAGHILYRYAREVLARTGEVERELEAWQGARSGRVTLGSNRTLGSYVLAPLLTRFWRQYPGASISLEIDHTDIILARTLSGEVDMGFVADRPPEPGLVGERIMQDPLVLVGSGPASSGAASQSDAAGAGSVREPARPRYFDRIDRAGLLSLPLIMPRSGSWYHEAVVRQLSGAGLSPRPVMELDGVEPIKRAVEAGTGVGFIPYSAVRREVEAGWLRVIAVEGLDLWVEFFMVYRRSKQFSPILKRLYLEIRRTLGLEDAVS